MATLRGLSATTSRGLSRLLRRAARLVATGVVALVAGFTLYAVTALPDLAPWHTTVLPGEFAAGPGAPADFAGYQALEERLFAASAARMRTWASAGDAWTHSRFNPASSSAQLAAGAPYNRSFRLTPPSPAGGALLVHGLSDSPYSMKALAEALYTRGFEVTVLRLPGHGTFPGMLTRTTHADWVAAVALAAADVAARTPPGQPFYVGGYSTGATLTLAYTLESLGVAGRRRPDRVLLVSPAIAITPLATLANVLDLLAVLPSTTLAKVRWQNVTPEYDPYKYNSFPVNATRQVNRATRSLQSLLARADADGQLVDLPPVVTWQSVVDSTVGARPTIDTLYARLAGAQHRLVLFDTNRRPGLRAVEGPGTRALVARLGAVPPRYTLEIVTNADMGEPPVVVQRLAPGNPVATLVAPGLAWPADTVSLGHVALPFRPDDPVYGYLPGSGHAGIPSLGALLLRGEAGATVVPLGALTRPRSNPFWALIDQQVGELVDADLAAAASAR